MQRAMFGWGKGKHCSSIHQLGRLYETGWMQLTIGSRRLSAYAVIVRTDEHLGCQRQQCFDEWPLLRKNLNG